jgi:hypothetical protein
VCAVCCVLKNTVVCDVRMTVCDVQYGDSTVTVQYGHVEDDGGLRKFGGAGS